MIRSKVSIEMMNFLNSVKTFVFEKAFEKQKSNQIKFSRFPPPLQSKKNYTIAYISRAKVGYGYKSSQRFEYNR